MFDDILNLVKEHLSNDPAVAAAIPADQQEAIHNEIATHLANSVAAPAATENGGGMFGGLLGKLESSIAGGGTVTNAIEGGLINSLTTKFGLPPSITGAISGALPGLLQKFAQKQAGTQNT